MPHIKIVDRNTPLAVHAKDLVYDQAMTSWVLLFEGERWLHIERVAIAQEFEGSSSSIIAGLASLSPHGEFDDPKEAPQIIGVWVHPEHRRAGIGTALVKALAEESMQRYGQAPKIVSATKSGAALVKAAERDNAGIIAVHAGGFGDLP